MHIAVDLDDSSIDTTSSIFSYYNDKHGTSFKREDLKVYSFGNLWGITYEESAREVEGFYQSKFYETIAPMPDSQYSLRSLKEDGHYLSVITGRGETLSSKTERSVERLFPKIFSNIFYTNSYGLVGGKKKKSDVCIQNNVDLLIDDDLLHIIDCVNSEIPVIVYPNPWNEFPPDGAMRLKNWIEILEVIRILSSI